MNVIEFYRHRASPESAKQSQPDAKVTDCEQFFARLRERNLLYVDKTEQIFNLMNVGSQVFLSLALLWEVAAHHNAEGDSSRQPGALSGALD
ncbi:MAG: hypothetical protein R2932_53970 [Caldilineaceae bacterium]